MAVVTGVGRNFSERENIWGRVKLKVLKIKIELLRVSIF